jgi:hypothetical protein
VRTDIRWSHIELKIFRQAILLFSGQQFDLQKDIYPYLKLRRHINIQTEEIDKKMMLDLRMLFKMREIKAKLLPNSMMISVIDAKTYIE